MLNTINFFKGQMKRLRNLQIVSNKYTECVAPAVDSGIWKAVRITNPRLRVHLITEGQTKNEMLFQDKAPVKSIIYDSPYISVRFLKLLKMAERTQICTMFGSGSLFFLFA